MSYFKTPGLTPENTDNRIDSVINFLTLRDLGCSRKDAIGYVNNKRYDSEDISNNLPVRLRNEFKTCLSKKKFGLDFEDKTEENFESITKTLDKLIEKNTRNLELQIKKADNYLKSVEKSARNLNSRKGNEELSSPDDNNREKSCSDTVKTRNFRKKNFENGRRNVKIGKVSNEKVLSPIEKYESLPSTTQTRRFPTYKSKINSNYQKSPKFEKYDKELLLDSPVSKLSSRKSVDFLIKTSPSFENDEDSSDTDLGALISEEKKIINMIREQKFHQAQKKGKEQAKLSEKVLQRKKVLEGQIQEKKQKNIEIKKQKILNAKKNRESIILKNKKKNVQKN